MGKNIMYYHREYGDGIICGNRDDKYIINFSGKIMYVPIDEIGKSLFIKGEFQTLHKLENIEEIDNNILVDLFSNCEIASEANEHKTDLNSIFDLFDNNIELVNHNSNIIINQNENSDYQIDEELYTDIWEKDDSKDKIIDNNEDNSEDNNEDNNQTNKDYVKRIEALDGSEYRNIVILDISTEKINNKDFLRIIGLDICTSTIVLIVDTNGKQFGLHNKNDEFMKLRNNTVIKAKFKYEPLEKFANVLRIISEFTIIGESDLKRLRIKYNDLNYYDYITSFEELSDMLEKYQNKEFYCITHFTGSEVKKYKNKNNYQLKVGRYAANINNKMDVSICEGLKFRGYGLMSCFISTNRQYPFIKVLKLEGSFLANSDYNLLKTRLKEREFNGFDDDDQNYNEIYDGSNSETYEDSLELMSYSRQRLWEESDHYTEEGYTSNYIEDGCDDSYFEEWEEEYPESENYEGNERLFVEPGSEWDDDFWEDDDGYEEELREYKEYKPSEEELKKWEEFNKIYKYCRKSAMYTSNIYKIEDISDDAFSINFEKIEKPNQEVAEADLEDIPF